MHVALAACALAAVLTSVAAAQDSPERAPAPGAWRTIAIDSRLAQDAGLSVGDRVILAAEPGGAGDTVVVAAITRPGADPSEVSRQEYRVRMHLDQLQRLAGMGDRVHRFAVATRGPAATDAAVAKIDAAGFGFRARRSRDVGAEPSAALAVAERLHRARGVLLKGDERRRGVAALRLIGISRGTIVKSIVVEAAAIAVLGSLFGAALGWSASLIVNAHYQDVYRTPLRFAAVTPEVLGLAL